MKSRFASARTWKRSFSNLAKVSMDRPRDADSTRARKSLAALLIEFWWCMKRVKMSTGVMAGWLAGINMPLSLHYPTHLVRVAGFLLLRLWIKPDKEAVSSSDVSAVAIVS